MTFPDMTPDSWAKLGWIATALAAMWCGWWLWRSVRKVDTDDERGDSPRDW